MNAYAEFLDRKKINDPDTGISNALSLPSVLKPHQHDIVKWSLRRGRAAIFAGTGLGKTLMELSWSDQVYDFTGKPVLIMAPLAVAEQHITEAEKFGMAANLVSFHPEEGWGINVTNYQKMDHFDLSLFGGVVLDESSILKSTDGKYRTKLISECSKIPFRLAATATPAPNDFMELGNHAEFLGVMSYTDMLATFFTHDGGDTQKWRLKGHAESEFWKWMASWAVMLRKPSDLGYDNAGYDLPPLNYHQHTVGVEYAPSLDTGLLFPMEARTLQERIAARRDSVSERVTLAASMTPADRPFVWWCNLNSEAEALAKLIPGSVNLSGSDKDDDKRRKAWPFEQWRSILVWQRYASPVWMDINQTNTLQYRAGRDEKDEQHISPLQLDVIERCLDLWSAKGETVLTPFLGIGSEVYSAVKLGRKGLGFELKPSYFRQAVKNIAELDIQPADTLFDMAGVA